MLKDSSGVKSVAKIQKNMTVHVKHIDQYFHVLLLVL